MSDVAVQTIQVGSRVAATRQISWTLEEFDDYPLVVVRDDEGTVTQIDQPEHRAFIEWDKDRFKRMRKSVHLLPGRSWPIRFLS